MEYMGKVYNSEDLGKCQWVEQNSEEFLEFHAAMVPMYGVIKDRYCRIGKNRHRAWEYFTAYKKRENERRRRYRKKKVITKEFDLSRKHRCEVCLELFGRVNLFWGFSLCNTCYFNPVYIQFIMFKKFTHVETTGEEEFSFPIVGEKGEEGVEKEVEGGSCLHRSRYSSEGPCLRGNCDKMEERATVFLDQGGLGGGEMMEEYSVVSQKETFVFEELALFLDGIGGIDGDNFDIGGEEDEQLLLSISQQVLSLPLVKEEVGVVDVVVDDGDLRRKGLEEEEEEETSLVGIGEDEVSSDDVGIEEETEESFSYEELCRVVDLLYGESLTMGV